MEKYNKLFNHNCALDISSFFLQCNIRTLQLYYETLYNQFPNKPSTI